MQKINKGNLKNKNKNVITKLPHKHPWQTNNIENKEFGSSVYK
jgi:hypothetical protein